MYHYGQQFRAGVGLTTMYATWDFETYSEAGFEFDPVEQKWRPAPGLNQNNKGLPGVGTYNYVTHPTFDILSLKYDLLDGRGMRFWRPVMTEFGLADQPHDLIAHIAAGKILEAFNTGFEAGVWNWHCSPRYGWPPLRLEQERCCMAKGKASAYPPNLADTGDVLKLVNRKDPYGDYLIKLLTVPKNPGATKRKPTAVQRGTPAPDAEPPAQRDIAELLSGHGRSRFNDRLGLHEVYNAHTDTWEPDDIPF